MPLPNLIIGGPPKTGTTSLFHWLSQHPEVGTSEEKETYYFYDPENQHPNRGYFHQTGWDGYESLFEHCENKKVILEASPGYIYSKTALSELPKLTDTKFLFILRPGWDRVYSEYRFHRFKTKKFQGSFQDFVQLDEYDSGQMDSQLHTVYFLEKWIKSLHADRVILIDFYKLSENPLAILTGLCALLNLHPGIYENFDFTVKNETINLKSTGFHRMALKVKSVFPRKIREGLLPLYSRLNQSQLPDKSLEESEEIERLREILEPEEVAFRAQYANYFF